MWMCEDVGSTANLAMSGYEMQMSNFYGIKFSILSWFKNLKHMCKYLPSFLRQSSS